MTPHDPADVEAAAALLERLDANDCYRRELHARLRSVVHAQGYYLALRVHVEAALDAAGRYYHSDVERNTYAHLHMTVGTDMINTPAPDEN
jgi:hypothetical protein